MATRKATPHLSRFTAMYHAVWYPTGGPSNYETSNNSAGCMTMMCPCSWMSGKNYRSRASMNNNNNNNNNNAANSQIVLGSTYAEKESKVNMVHEHHAISVKEIGNEVSTLSSDHHHHQEMKVDSLNSRNNNESTGEWIDFKYGTTTSEVSTQ
jgi:hypothetical protein